MPPTGRFGSEMAPTRAAGAWSARSPTLWPFTAELFESDDVTRDVAGSGIGPDPEALRPAWDAYVDRVLSDATLMVPESTWRPTGGRHRSAYRAVWVHAR